MLFTNVVELVVDQAKSNETTAMGADDATETPKSAGTLRKG